MMKPLCGAQIANNIYLLKIDHLTAAAMEEIFLAGELTEMTVEQDEVACAA